MSTERIETIVRLPTDVQNSLTRAWKSDQQRTGRSVISDSVKHHLLEVVNDCTELGVVAAKGLNVRRRRIDAAAWAMLAEASELCGLSRAELLTLCLRRELGVKPSVNLSKLQKLAKEF